MPQLSFLDLVAAFGLAMFFCIALAVPIRSLVLKRNSSAILPALGAVAAWALAVLLGLMPDAMPFLTVVAAGMVAVPVVAVAGTLLFWRRHATEIASLRDAAWIIIAAPAGLFCAWRLWTFASMWTAYANSIPIVPPVMQ